MNTEHPHDLLSDDEVRRLPAEKRRHYVPVPENQAALVRKMTPDERAAWLNEHPLDALRLQRAQEKRARRAEKRNKP